MSHEINTRTLKICQWAEERERERNVQEDASSLIFGVILAGFSFGSAAVGSCQTQRTPVTHKSQGSVRFR